MKKLNKKAQMEPLIKYILWAVFFALILVGVYFLIKFSSTLAG